ncbi:hypothetical protein [Pedobacter panaciterrae]|uniref:hypothetical protein n=1 Tax=Pedobacter panaciterrae TaxID=363849 RepID=UPI0025987CA3|nr:hypothetical protein [uncultured Pedobacter sp.]
MIYLSAQPSEFYFKWQIEVMLTNFKKVGIPKEQIHVLLVKNDNQDIKEMVLEYDDHAQFFFYTDTRQTVQYMSTIRPHIIKKHIDQYPSLQKETIFYHDSDIIFRTRLDEHQLVKGNDWLLSNATSYIGVEVLDRFGPNILSELCTIVDIPVSSAYEKKLHFGGAQYVLKNTNYSFWDKHEKDCEQIYRYLQENKQTFKKIHLNSCSSVTQDLDFVGLQEWCADMWSMLLNGIYFGHNFRILKELDFCWPDADIADWHNHTILHNAGVTDKTADRLFYKSHYLQIDPMKQELREYDYTKCTAKYLEAMDDVRKKRRAELNNCAFIFIDERNNMRQVETFVAYLAKYFKNYTLHIISSSALEMSGDNIQCHKEENLGFLHDKVQEDHWVFLNGSIVFDPELFRKSLETFISSEDKLHIPFNTLKEIQNPYNIELFRRKLNTTFLTDFSNQAKKIKLHDLFFVKAKQLNRLGFLKYDRGLQVQQILYFMISQLKSAKREESQYFYLDT